MVRRVNDVPEIDTATKRGLAREKITSVEALWRCVGMNEDGTRRDLQTGIAALSHKTNISEEDLIKVLAYGSRTLEVSRPFGFWLSRLLVIALMLAFAWHAATEFVPQLQGYPTVIRSTRAQVIAKNDLPAFHVIDPSDIELKRDTSHPRALTDADLVAGKYTLVPIHGGQTINADNVSASALEAADIASKQILHLPTVYTELPRGVELGKPVEIVLVMPRDDGESGDVQRFAGLLLDSHAANNGQVISVAVDEPDVDAIHAMLTNAAVFLVQQAN